MTNEYKVLLAIVAGVGSVGYSIYLRSKIVALTDVVGISIRDVSERTHIDVADAIIDHAVQKAVDREVSLIANRAFKELRSEIKTQVRNDVSLSSRDIKTSVSDEIALQVKNINMDDLEREVINKAKDAIAQKFDGRLESLLEEFNSNLNNVSKIYSSIAKSIARE